MTFGGSKLNSYPFNEDFYNSGSITLTSSDLDTIKINSIKAIHPTSISDAQYVNNGGTHEIWTLSQTSQGILRYPLSLISPTLTNIGSATVSTPLNNTMSQARKFRINYATNQIAITGFGLNVVRVYDFNVIRTTGLTVGANGTGGHLYNIGLPNGSIGWLQASSAVNNGTTGRLSQPYSIDINPVNGNWVIGHTSGFGTPTSTSSGGFIAEYNSSGIFQRIVCALNGASSTGYVGVGGGQCLGDIRYDSVNNKLYACTNNGTRLLVLDMTTAPISLVSGITTAPTGSPTYTGGGCLALGYSSVTNKVYKGINNNERPVICSMNANSFSHTINNAGDDFHFGDDYRATLAGRPYYKHSQVNNVHSIDRIGDPLALGLGDWFVNCDYFSASFQTFLKPTMTLGNRFQMFNTYEPTYIVDIDSPITLPSGWSVDGFNIGGWYETNNNYIRFNPIINKVMIHAHYIGEYNGSFSIRVKK